MSRPAGVEPAKEFVTVPLQPLLMVILHVVAAEGKRFLQQVIEECSVAARESSSHI